MDPRHGLLLLEYSRTSGLAERDLDVTMLVGLRVLDHWFRDTTCGPVPIGLAGLLQTAFAFGGLSKQVWWQRGCRFSLVAGLLPVRLLLYLFRAQKEFTEESDRSLPANRLQIKSNQCCTRVQFAQFTP